MSFKVTKEMLKAAVTYMPLYTKEAVSKQIAELCLEDIDTAEQNKIGEAIIAMPHLKGENLTLKNILLLNTLVGYYLDQDMPETDENGKEIDAFERYDYYAGGHLLNQIERFKSDPEVKDIVFDLMSDYKDFKKLVDTEIYNAKANTNDLIPRMFAAIEVLSTPETMNTIVEELKKLGEERKETLEEKKNAIIAELDKKNNAESGEK